MNTDRMNFNCELVLVVTNFIYIHSFHFIHVCNICGHETDRTNRGYCHFQWVVFSWNVEAYEYIIPLSPSFVWFVYFKSDYEYDVWHYNISLYLTSEGEVSDADLYFHIFLNGISLPWWWPLVFSRVCLSNICSDAHLHQSPVREWLKSPKTDCSNPHQDLGPIGITVLVVSCPIYDAAERRVMYVCMHIMFRVHQPTVE